MASGMSEVPLKAPCCGMPMIHQTRATMPAADSTAPGRSGFCHGPFDSDTKFANGLEVILDGLALRLP